MNRAKKYFMNALLLSLVTVIMRAVSVSFNAYVTQKIGSEAIGLFTLVMSVYTLAVTLASSGVNLAAVRMTAERLALCEEAGADERTLRRALRFEMLGCIKYSLFFGIFASLLLYVLSDIIGKYVLCDTRTVLSLKVLSFALLPISLTSALSGYFTGLRKIYKNAVVSVCEQIVKITITAGALVLIAPRGIEYACLAVVGGSAVSEGASLLVSLLLFAFDKNKGNGTAKCVPGEKASPLSRAFDIAFPTAMGAYVRQGLLCAEHIAIPSGLRKFGSGGSAALASYGTLHAMAFPLIFFPASIIGAFASLLIPELSECGALGKSKRVQKIAKKVVSFSLVFSIGCGGLFLAFGSDMGLGIYNSADAGKYIAAFAPLVPVMYLDTA
ncbi:MAG: oligosaccharide flippase family protein, partial [Clostridia bacterium]|nr:oligosaccharide flippase family protein [Clostridia bacterium]